MLHGHSPSTSTNLPASRYITVILRRRPPSLQPPCPFCVTIPTNPIRQDHLASECNDVWWLRNVIELVHIAKPSYANLIDRPNALFDGGQFITLKPLQYYFHFMFIKVQTICPRSPRTSLTGTPFAPVSFVYTETKGAQQLDLFLWLTSAQGWSFCSALDLIVSQLNLFFPPLFSPHKNHRRILRAR